MKWNHALDEIFGSKIKIRLLRYLCNTTGQFSGRDLAKASGYSHTRTYTALEELENLGVLGMNRVGTSHLYSLKTNNYIVKKIISPIFSEEKKLIPEVARRFFEKMGDELLFVVLFGSVARQEDAADSDIDFVLVVRDGADKEKLEDMSAGISLDASIEFGGSVSGFVFTETEYEERVAKGKAMWEDVKKEGIPIQRQEEEAKVG